MNTHFCKVGKIRPNLNKSYKINVLKEKVMQQSFKTVLDNKKQPKGFDVAS